MVAFRKVRLLQSWVGTLDVVAEHGPIFVSLGILFAGILWVVLIILGWFYSWAILATGIISFLSTCLVYRTVVYKPVAKNEHRLWSNWLALIVVTLFITITAVFVSQNVFVTRDPGVYSVTARWLTNHSTSTAPTIDTGEDQGATSVSLGFNKNPNNTKELYAQGLDLLPILMAVAGRIGGDVVQLTSVSVLAGAALWSVYGFARTIIKESYALLAMSALAVSMPMLYFSRDAYSEPLSMLFLFSSLSLAAIALKNPRRQLVWLLAGLAAGATCMTRVDGVLVLCGYATFFL